jgi:hypothetical protein
MLPFTQEQFVSVFVKYNNAIWPTQIVAYLLGAIAIALLFRKPRGGDWMIAAVLAAMWLWTAIAYHALFFADINKAAYLFAALFVIQSGYLFYEGCYRGRIHFAIRSEPLTWLGLGLAGYATILYPTIGVLTGHSYPAMPMFGVTPCPVTIFTLGMLLATVPPLSRWLLVIPFVWSLIGGSAAILLHVPQDWLLLVSGVIAVPPLAFRSGSASRPLQTS